MYASDVSSAPLSELWTIMARLRRHCGLNDEARALHAAQAPPRMPDLELASACLDHVSSRRVPSL